MNSPTAVWVTIGVVAILVIGGLVLYSNRNNQTANPISTTVISPSAPSASPSSSLTPSPSLQPSPSTSPSSTPASNININITYPNPSPTPSPLPTPS